MHPVTDPSTPSPHSHIPLAGLVAEVGEISVPSTRSVQLPDLDCVYVQLASWTSTDSPDKHTSHSGASLSPADNTAYVLYYGFNGRLFAQIFPGDTTQLLPVANLSQISAQSGSLNPDLILHYVAYKRPTD